MPANWPRDLEMNAGVDQMFDGDAQDKITQIGRARYTGTVSSVEYIPGWNLTGANTNSRTFTLINKRGDGSGTTTIAALSMTAGVSLSRGVAVSLSVSASGIVIAPGDTLEWQSLKAGSGLPDPGGRVLVQMAIS